MTLEIHIMSQTCGGVKLVINKR